MTTATTDLTAILDKIARLKALEAQPGTPEEAAAATAAIQRLMLRHNLTEAQVSTAGRNDQSGYDSTRYDIGAATMWRKYLMHTVAETTFCTAVFDHAGRGVNIVGEKHNVAVATGLYEYLSEAIERLADEGWEHDGKYQPGTTARRWKHAFRTGATNTVMQRLKDQFAYAKRQEDAAGNDTSALVVVKGNELARAVRKLHPRSRSTASRAQTSDAHGAARGREAGRGISLADQIAG